MVTDGTGQQVPARGRLKVYLGAAPGVGKTFAMLEEAQDLAGQGRDVVLAFVEDHGRARTAALTTGVEAVPRAQVSYRGATFPEMDLDAVLARKPEIAVVDELAHTLVRGDAGPTRTAGAQHDKRWQDVETLLDAGIDVLSTVNVQHLESLNDVVAAITGTRQRETLPDKVLRAADQIELVDLTPDALRVRLAKGEVYTSDRIDAAMANYFRVGNLTALRELALLWLADQVEEGLAKYRAQNQIEQPWPARERIVVAVTGGPESETLIRRGLRIVGRIAGRELMAVHVVRDDGLAAADPAALDAQRALVESLGGSWHTVVGDDIAETLLDFARGVNASQLVLGVSRSGRFAKLLGPGVGTRVIIGSGDIDVHMVTHIAAGGKHVPKSRRPSRLARWRRISGWIAAVLGPVLATVVFLLIGRDDVAVSTNMLVYITVVVAVALLGGLWPAVTAALIGSALVNWFFTHPTGGLTVSESENITALFIFLLVAAAVAWIVDVAARRTREASTAAAEAALLSELASGVLREGSSVPALLERLRETFQQESAALFEREPGAPWRNAASAGALLDTPATATTTLSLDENVLLALTGRTVTGRDQKVLEAYAGRLAAIRNQQQLDRARHDAAELSAGNAMRTALLAAVSHDLRTPLAGIKVAVSSLRLDDVALSEEDQAELLETIEESADKLDALVANLLDMSRLQTGTLTIARDIVYPADVIAAALSGSQAAHADSPIDIVIAEGTPPVLGDFGLTERIVANLVDNALRHGAGCPITVTASALPDRVELRVIDRGPGVPATSKAAMFKPFQRLGDVPQGLGVGLGLAVARGFAEAVGGSLEPEDTPGGGLTMVLALPVAGALPEPAEQEAVASR